ncbi:acyl-CoA synthetase [Streptomyces marispadix]|uniref:Acyl-CoA synthetase n=1 Tax=Streptomyces marispadix TaxID=2922868 RepID=A0ABS9T242_9ACTN|nr:acyl-CoA synthetase [Streptomyces marispadix]MCH6162577.1 acyl-CoA synthetase [Streptomyces marispadix]
MTARPVREGEIPFATSGHTGEPVRWWRTREQLRAEVELIAATAIGEVGQVISLAPPEHLFGRLFGVELPRRYGIEVHNAWQDPVIPPTWRPGVPALFVCLPASWVVLRSLAPRIAELPRAVALHSAGPTTAHTRQLVSALRGHPFRAVELFGSTETGAVASREIAADADDQQPWRLLPDVRAELPDGQDERRLTVSSPRLARRDGHRAPPRTWQMGDLVRAAGERRFTFVGRASRLIKVNGLRCDLGRVEQTVATALPGLEAVCLPKRDAVRGEHYELVYADPRGEFDSRSLWPLLRRALGGTPLPRSLRRVPRIPRSSTGKPLTHLLGKPAGTAVAASRVAATTGEPARGGEPRA